eukprot:gb/GEZN01009750.1/.p1 GENE.gb/GEZN01009750.1/~~gb/GEZN01009750.1/.p1  ORF type:complete len:270 (-),score=3.30 gb/GEZN01009750.1/:413-1222(-)
MYDSAKLDFTISNNSGMALSTEEDAMTPSTTSLDAVSESQQDQKESCVSKATETLRYLRIGDPLATASGACDSFQGCPPSRPAPSFCRRVRFLGIPVFPPQAHSLPSLEPQEDLCPMTSCPTLECTSLDELSAAVSVLSRVHTTIPQDIDPEFEAADHDIDLNLALTDYHITISPAYVEGGYNNDRTDACPISHNAQFATPEVSRIRSGSVDTAEIFTQMERGELSKPVAASLNKHTLRNGAQSPWNDSAPGFNYDNAGPMKEMLDGKC